MSLEPGTITSAGGRPVVILGQNNTITLDDGSAIDVYSVIELASLPTSDYYGIFRPAPEAPAPSDPAPAE
jgi:hypothetical protein